MDLPIAHRAHNWMLNEALPFWAEHGIDREHGGYVESLNLEATRKHVDKKRLRVIGRQIYVFSHASLLGFDEGTALAGIGYEFLTSKAWLGPDAGWPRLVNAKGGAIDPMPDLYDNAFVLFALGWYYRATGDGAAIDWAHRTLDFIEHRMRTPNGGFWHALPPEGYRQQNPHMHLLEAALALYEPTGEERFADLARDLIALFREKFYDRGNGALAEFYDNDWHKADGEAGRIVEPGHQFEWAWILANAGRLLEMDLANEARGLAKFAEVHGVDRHTYATYQSVRDDGAPIDNSSRAWPNTERIKAAVALYDIDGADPRPVFNQSAGLLLDRYLNREPRGTWYDVFDKDAKMAARTTPTSTLYHIFLAFSEMLRVVGNL